MEHYGAHLRLSPIPFLRDLYSFHATLAQDSGCKMSMDMMKLTKDDLVDKAAILGAMEFMELSEGAQLLLV